MHLTEVETLALYTLGVKHTCAPVICMHKTLILVGSLMDFMCEVCVKIDFSVSIHEIGVIIHF